MLNHWGQHGDAFFAVDELGHEGADLRFRDQLDEVVTIRRHGLQATGELVLGNVSWNFWHFRCGTWEDGMDIEVLE